ncbi:MAG: hypothetical protein ACRCYV_00760 [Aeromonas sp.]
MSSLLHALRRKQVVNQPNGPATAFATTHHSPASTRHRWVWIAVLLALGLGAGGHYAWQQLSHQPIEQKVEVKTVIKPDFIRVEPKALTTRPLPLPPVELPAPALVEPEPEPMPRPAPTRQAAPAKPRASQPKPPNVIRYKPSLAEQVQQAWQELP